MADSFGWFIECVVPYINFFIFLGILVYFSKKPLSQLAGKRKSDFDAHQRLAKETLGRAKEGLDQLTRRMKGLNEEIASMKSKALTEAKREAQKIIDDGKRQAEQILEDAKKLREAEFAEAQRKLALETMSRARADLLGRLEKEFDSSKDKHFIEKRLEEIASLRVSVPGGV